MTYPLPAYAANIWLAGDKLMLGFPETRNSPGHAVALPATERGLQVALQLLHERMVLPAESKIGTRAEPTQAWIEEEVKKLKARQKLSDDPDEALKQLGF